MPNIEEPADAARPRRRRRIRTLRTEGSTMRRILAAAAVALAIAVTGVTAARPAAAATQQAMQPATTTQQVVWTFAGVYDTADECNLVGAVGVADGSYLAFDCEPDFFLDGFDLYVAELVTVATGCATPAQAYMVYNHGIYSSGNEEQDRSHPATLSIPRGTRVTLGGNGIKPGQQVFFYIYNASGQQVLSGKSNTAGGNCVANEAGLTINLPPGQYLAKGYYQSGNTNTIYFDPEVILQVS
jgi:hypothetical protein